MIPFLLVAFGITWGIAAFFFSFPVAFQSLFGTISIFNPMFIAAVAAPSFSAILVTLAGSGRPGLKALLSRLVRFRFGLSWYLLSLLVIPAVTAAAGLVLGFRGRLPSLGPSGVLLLMLNLLYTGPLGEELGWRGYALPRLLARFSPFTASILLGAIWGTWHLPSFFASGLPQSVATLPWFLAGGVLLSLVASWFLIRTGRSIVPSILLHYSVNFSLTMLGLPIPALAIVLAICVALILLLDRGVAWFQPPSATGTAGAVAGRPAGAAP